MAIPAFTDAQLEALAKVLGDWFKGSELGPLLAQAGVSDVSKNSTKWRRLLDDFQAVQADYRVGTHVGVTIQHAFEPARWHDRADQYETARSDINCALAFAGLTIGQDGKLGQVTVARTLDEAQERAGRLRAALVGRRVHAGVLQFCQAELLKDDYFHAVLEATKSIAAKMREKTGLTSDGAALVDEGLGGDKPKLAFNTLQTPTNWSEHRGTMNLLKGLFGAFRNPTAHEPRISYPISEQDALDLLTLASLLMRRLDTAVPTGW